MKEKEKKKIDVVNILVYFAIGALALVIILPPVFRMMLPKEKVPEKPKDVIVALTCSKMFAEEKTQEKITFNYQNDALQKLIFIYSVKEDTPEETPTEPSGEDEVIPPATDEATPQVDGEDSSEEPIPTAQTRLTAFYQFRSVEVKELEDGRKQITFTPEALQEHSSNALLIPFLGTKNAMEANLKEDGYTCQVLS